MLSIYNDLIHSTLVLMFTYKKLTAVYYKLNNGWILPSRQPRQADKTPVRTGMRSARLAISSSLCRTMSCDV